MSFEKFTLVEHPKLNNNMVLIIQVFDTEIHFSKKNLIQKKMHIFRVTYGWHPKFIKLNPASTKIPSRHVSWIDVNFYSN